MPDCDYIYLIQEREFINTNVYKVGRSVQINCNRIKSYPKGSTLCMIIKVSDCVKAETKIIKLLKNDKKIKRMLDYGREYFKGDENYIMNVIYECVHSINTNKKKNDQKLTNIDDKQNPMYKHKKIILKLFTITNNENDYISELDVFDKIIEYDNSIDPFECINTIYKIGGIEIFNEKLCSHVISNIKFK